MSNNTDDRTRELLDRIHQQYLDSISGVNDVDLDEAEENGMTKPGRRVDDEEWQEIEREPGADR
ncbi:MAG: hypothetical protein WC455_11625 [Dehalococcoidia bacterium]|jgi:hypothetical protein